MFLCLHSLFKFNSSIFPRSTIFRCHCFSRDQSISKITLFKKASQKIDLKYRFISQHKGNGKSMNPFVFSQGSTSNAAFAQIAKILKIALFKDASERINLKAG